MLVSPGVLGSIDAMSTWMSSAVSGSVCGVILSTYLRQDDLQIGEKKGFAFTLVFQTTQES